MIGIGIDIGSTAAKAAVVDGEGSVAWTCVQPTGFSSVDASERLREALAAAGYDVTADDVRVVGYDDSPLALTTMPTLTSVRPPFLQIVTEALRLIGQGPDQAAHISLLPQLIVRGSTVVRS